MLRNAVSAAVLVVLITAVSANGDPLVSRISGPFTLDSFNTSGVLGALGTPWTVNETYTGIGSGVLLFTDTDGNSLGPGNPTGTDHETGRWILKTVTNNTGVTWTSFELELQETLGIPSGQLDGLSFADGA